MYVVSKTDKGVPKWLALRWVGSSHIPEWTSDREDSHKFNAEESAHLWKYRFREHDPKVEKYERQEIREPIVFSKQRHRQILQSASPVLETTKKKTRKDILRDIRRKKTDQP